MSIKVSVIVPVFNKEQYLEKCIESIVSQTLDDIEIICINDGSTDRSLGVLNELSELHDNITVINQSNQGVGAARNTGIDASSGEYIAFMDPDDYYPDIYTIETLYTKAIEHDAKICGGSFSSLKDNKIITEYNGNNSGYTFTKEGMIDYLDYQFDFGFQRFIYLREMIKENSLVFPNNIRFQDPPFFVDSMMCARSFYAIIEPTYRYRENYKEIGWNLAKKVDLLKGLIHNLRASVGRLSKLNELTYRRLTSDYYQKIFLSKNYAFDNVVINDLLKEAASYVDTSIDQSTLRSMIDRTEKHPSLSTRPDVSVIIPVYKVEKYIDECVLSVLNQNNPPNLQIILVDDGSPDTCGEICDSYSEKDERVLTIHKVNGGLSSARNAGMDYAKGKYVYFLDSDDKLREDALRSMFDLMEENNLEVLFFDATTFYDTPELELSKSSFKGYYRDRGKSNEVTTGRALTNMFFKNNTYRTPVQLSVISKNFYDQHGLHFIDGILHEDNIFTFTCLMEASRAMYVNEDYYLRRIRDDSIMTAKLSFKNFRGYIRCIVEMMRYLHDHPEYNEGQEILERLKKTAISVFKGLDTFQKRNLSTMPCDELFAALGLGIDPNSYRVPYVSIYLQSMDGDIENCIKNLSNQSIPIKVHILDCKKVFPNCVNVKTNELNNLFSNDECALKLLMRGPVLIKTDSIMEMVTSVAIYQDARVNDEDLISFYHNSEIRPIASFDKDLVISNMASINYGKSIIAPHQSGDDDKHWFDDVLKEDLMLEYWSASTEESLSKMVNLCEQSEMDSPIANLLLARAYAYGKGKERDIKMSSDYYLRAYKMGSNRAGIEYVEFAYQNYDGDDLENAAAICTELANNGDGDAQYTLSRMYLHGKGVSRNIGEYRRWLEEAANSGHNRARKELNASTRSTSLECGSMTKKDNKGHSGSEKYDNSESAFKSIINYCKDVVDEGDPLIAYYLSKAYYEGKGVEKDVNKANEYFKMASERGYSDANNEIFNILWEIGTAESFNELLTLASKKLYDGDAKSMQIIGRAYRDGTGISKNLIKSAEWMQKAYSVKDYWVNEYLDVLWNIHDERSLEEMHRICEEEYFKGNAVAIRLLARFYMERGDKDKAKEMYRKALYSNPGLIIFEYTSVLYNAGRPEDLAECLRICNDFSETGNKDALYRLGKMYVEGKGVEADHDKALDFLTKASAAGSNLATEELKNLNSKPDKGRWVSRIRNKLKF